ncbi:spore gernimation protein GerPD [Halobacillus litoralis]|uniref:Spore gernimation protein GerPD n=1 Tax=Halobacillus litoralis TaxID=45668 RepID=A0A845DPC4_9BACI|nr:MULTISPECIES: spore gernimation protein GerPD [Halobacillus]MCA1022540.1 spore gernimation protein GerPD [Halobacillus litoralis]MYL18415.1 spore gernimation protein GerPD [Halobacillus litoralis]MYL30578.1 spore gernimation protein GerPD [Halobacillus halophilus]MYL38595.1 spore gernimation protein GerPD [Halobacillus litoralis]
MNHIVHNYGLHVGNIRVTGVAASSVFLIGDNKTIRLQSFFDTPPESLIIGPFDEVDTDADAGFEPEQEGGQPADD